MTRWSRELWPWATVVLVVPLASAPRTAATPPTITYALHLDPSHLDAADIAIRFAGAPSAFHIAMKVHAEYDAKYWRYLSDMRVDGTADASRAAVARQDSTLWLVTLPGGAGVVHYRINIQPPGPPAFPGALRRVWRSYVRADGALINPPDFFLYSPEFADNDVRLELDIPRVWRIATALEAVDGSTTRVAHDAAALLNAPILMGAFHEWTFTDRGATYRVVYWPQSDAASFDTTAFVAGLRALARETMQVFGGAPFANYYFLIEDGASDALEHRASVTIGVSSARLASDPRASVHEIEHEFFHAWNLVAIRPAGYNDLSYRPPSRTTGLWLGEGVTLYYADALPRRAGLVDSIPSRLSHLSELLERYYASPGIMRVPASRASLAFGDSPVANSDATGGYYVQGELIANALDALIRDSTHEARGLDDVMHALYLRSQFIGYRGFASSDVRTVVDSVCTCRTTVFFDRQVDGPVPIDLEPALARIGFTPVVDSVPVTDSAGHPLPDLRLRTDFAAPPDVIRLVVTDSATAWAVAGLHTGDEVVALRGFPIHSRDQLQSAMRRIQIGDTVLVDIQRHGARLQIAVHATGYSEPRVRFLNAQNVTPDQQARQQRWMRGN